MNGKAADFSLLPGCFVKRNAERSAGLVAE
jgi:hypothetical protein